MFVSSCVKRPQVRFGSGLVRSVDYRGRDLTPAVCGRQYRVAPTTEKQPITTATLPPDEAAAPALLHARALAQLLGCSSRHLYRLADRGGLREKEA
jgi:hypothetical protein